MKSVTNRIKSGALKLANHLANIEGAMLTVNMHDAKTRLSYLVEQIEQRRESEIIIARNGVPVARLMPLAASTRVGAAKHMLPASGLPATIEAFNENDAGIAALFQANAARGVAP
jgi:prevent-host-death family protein